MIEYSCIPHGPIKLATITIPGVLILLFNLIVFFLVIRTIYKSEITKRKKSSIKKRAKQLVFLFILLGIPMLIQLLSSFLKNEFFELVSIILNTSMGIFMFLILIVGNKEMRSHIASSIRPRSTTKKHKLTSSSKSTTKLKTFSTKFVTNI